MIISTHPKDIGLADAIDEKERLDICLSVTMSEDDGDEDSPKRAKIEAITAGWNLNDIYIPTEVLPIILEFIMAKPKIYVNHDLYAYMGRDVFEWAATYENVKLNEDKTKIVGDIVFTANPKTFWLYKECKRNAKDVQFSMHFSAISQEYKDEAQNRTGMKVVGINAYKSTDIVSYGAAGGQALQVYNSIVQEKLNKFQTNQSNQEEKLKMEIKSTQDLLANYPTLVAEIVNAELAKKEKETAISQSSQKVTELTNSVTALTSEKTDLAAKVTELTNSVTALTTKNTELTAEVDKYKAVEQLNAWKTEVETEITNSQIDSRLVTPLFKDTLFAQKEIGIVKNMLEDRKSLTTGSVIQNGSAAGSATDSETKPKLSDDDIANGIKKK
ncbi:MAG TPA: hypothetical protein VI815_03015 [Candidatus Nanoarchaeia archaeon]|nr:hypothetical protein [Candidatus Nanoarchaeia archaeon]